MKLARILFKTLAIGILGGALLLLSGCDGLKARDLIRQGNALFKNGEYKDAINAYESALQVDPNVRKIYRSIGLAYMALYKPGSKTELDIVYSNSAIDAFKRYLETFPDDLKVYDYLVGMYVSSERIDDAIAYYDNKHTVNPLDPEPMKALAALYAKKRDFDNTLKWYENVLNVFNTPELVTQKSEIYYTIGVLFWEQVHYSKDLPIDQRFESVDIGQKNLDEALKINPDYIDALAYKNLLYREIGKIYDDWSIRSYYAEIANGYLTKAQIARANQQAIKDAEKKAETPQAGNVKS